MSQKTFSISVPVEKKATGAKVASFNQNMREVLGRERGVSVSAHFESGGGLLCVEFIPLHDLSFVQGVMLGLTAGLGIKLIDGFEITAD